MNRRTLFVWAAFAAALPLASAWPAEPSGPQGTQLYGTRALEQSAAAGASQPARTDRGAAVATRSDAQRGARRTPYNGPSFETNPPAPAP